MTCKTTALAATILAALTTPAAAFSNNAVIKVEVNNPASPHCFRIRTANDAQFYGVSQDDPAYIEVVALFLDSRKNNFPVTFVVGNPNTEGFHPEHCPGPDTFYIHTIGR